MDKSVDETVKSFEKAVKALQKEVRDDPRKARDILLRFGIAEKDAQSPNGIRLAKPFR